MAAESKARQNDPNPPGQRVTKVSLPTASAQRCIERAKAVRAKLRPKRSDPAGLHPLVQKVSGPLRTPPQPPSHPSASLSLSLTSSRRRPHRLPHLHPRRLARRPRRHPRRAPRQARAPARGRRRPGHEGGDRACGPDAPARRRGDCLHVGARRAGAAADDAGAAHGARAGEARRVRGGVS